MKEAVAGLGVTDLGTCKKAQGASLDRTNGARRHRVKHRPPFQKKTRADDEKLTRELEL
jgi:hypothetical protein